MSVDEEEEPYRRIRNALEAEAKRSVALQPLKLSFFETSRTYLDDLTQRVRQNIEADPGTNDVIRASQELRQARESLERLVEYRMSKVLELARRASRPGAALELQHALRPE